MPKKHCEITVSVNGAAFHSVDWFEFGDQLHWRTQPYGKDKPVLHSEKAAIALCVFLNESCGGTDECGNLVLFKPREREPSE